MEYNQLQYLYPPRPEMTITPDILPAIEQRKWLAQFKKNGTNTVIFRTPEGKIFYYNRHKALQKWDTPAEVNVAFNTLLKDAKGWCVMVAELLHNKHKSFRNVLYIHDILVYDGDYLIGRTYIERYNILAKIFNSNVEALSHYVITANIWLAKNHYANFAKLFKDIKDPTMDEGLVLKDPNSKLTFCTKVESNANSQLKCRYGTKNYGN